MPKTLSQEITLEVPDLDQKTIDLLAETGTELMLLLITPDSDGEQEGVGALVSFSLHNEELFGEFPFTPSAYEKRNAWLAENLAGTDLAARVFDGQDYKRLTYLRDENLALLFLGQFGLELTHAGFPKEQIVCVEMDEAELLSGVAYDQQDYAVEMPHKGIPDSYRAEDGGLMRFRREDTVDLPLIPTELMPRFCELGLFILVKPIEVCIDGDTDAFIELSLDSEKLWHEALEESGVGNVLDDDKLKVVRSFYLPKLDAFLAECPPWLRGWLDDRSMEKHPQDSEQHWQHTANCHDIDEACDIAERYVDALERAGFHHAVYLSPDDQ